jgi:D-3-phosphoglycerate dehydrogenase
MTQRLRVFLAYTPAEFERYYSEDALALLRMHCEVVMQASPAVLDGAELAEAASDCDVVIAHRSVAGTDAAFSRMPRLLAFLRGAVDISTVDVDAASRHGILVARATRGFGRAVAELGAGMMLSLARDIARSDHGYKTGEPHVPAKGGQLMGATLGLVGFGHIGEQLAMIGAGLGMHVIAHDPYALPDRLGDRARPLDEVLATADYLVCLAASTPETRGLFGVATFARMKRGAYFINLARGDLVDEDALVAALDSRHLAGAGLDVGSAADQKPALRLAQRPDVLATPHVGGMTVAARSHQAMDTARQVLAIAGGQMPQEVVNAAAAARLSAWQRQRQA